MCAWQGNPIGRYVPVCTGTGSFEWAGIKWVAEGRNSSALSTRHIEGWGLFFEMVGRTDELTIKGWGSPDYILTDLSFNPLLPTRAPFRARFCE